MNNFYFDSVESLPKITTDPKKLAYLRLPFKDIYEAILKKFKSQPKNYHEVYLVL